MTRRSRLRKRQTTMRKGIAQRIADPILAELQVDAERAVLIGEMADEDVENVSGIEIAVLSAAAPDYFGDAIELKVDAAIRRLLEDVMHLDEDDDEEDVERHFVDNRYGLPVKLFICSDIDTFADMTSWE